MKEKQEVNIDKLVVVWTREQYIVEAETQEEAVSIARELEQTGDADNVEVIWDSLTPIDPLQIVQNRIAESTVQVFVEGVYCEDNNPKLNPFDDLRIVAQVQACTDDYADVPNFLAINVGRDLMNKVIAMRELAKQQDVVMHVKVDAEYFLEKEYAGRVGEKHDLMGVHDFVAAWSALMILPSGGVYFEAHSEAHWAVQIESEDISQHFN